jgi:hypothetical protein
MALAVRYDRDAIVEKLPIPWHRTVRTTKVAG